MLTVKASAELISFMKDWVNHSVTCETLPARTLDPTPLYLFYGDSKGHCVPGCSNNSVKYAATYYRDECAAMNPQVTKRSRQSFIQR